MINSVHNSREVHDDRAHKVANKHHVSNAAEEGDQEKQAACVSWLRKAGGSPAAEVAAWLEQRQHSKGR